MKTHTKSRLIPLMLGSFALSVAAVLAAATETWITFESVPGVTPKTNYFDGSGSPENARLTDQLQLSHGVSFRSSAPYVLLVTLGNQHATSGLNGIAGVTSGHVLKYNEPVTITFSMPGAPAIPAVTDFVSIRGDQNPATGSAKMEAFDPDGLSLGSVIAADVRGGLLLSLSAPNIHSIKLTQTRSDIAFDDLRFNELRPSMSAPPTASAGEDRQIHAGETIVLDGGGSSDDNTATPDLRFQWKLIARPAGSTAELILADTQTPELTADVAGEYVVSLVVTDGDGQASDPDTALISSSNMPPVADAGSDRSGFTGQEITLDASQSYDPDSYQLTFSWSLTSPSGDPVDLHSDSTAFPGFTPVTAGTYLATVRVSDPFGEIGSDTVMISAIDPGDFVASQIADAIDIIGKLTGDEVTNNGNRRAIQRFLTQALESLRSGDVAEVISKLIQAGDRTDGCIFREGPDGNGSGRDWIITCEAQAAVYEKLSAALKVLSP